MMIAAMFGGGLGSHSRLPKSQIRGSKLNTIMLNYIATYLVAYLLDVPLREPPEMFPKVPKLLNKLGFHIY